MCQNHIIIIIASSAQFGTSCFSSTIALLHQHVCANGEGPLRAEPCSEGVFPHEMCQETHLRFYGALKELEASLGDLVKHALKIRKKAQNKKRDEKRKATPAARAKEKERRKKKGNNMKNKAK